MNDTTVVYFTSNREKPDFEDKIQKSLLKTICDLPLISVSQKPIDFGTNICVGEVGSSNQNAWRQLQVGAKEAKTKYVCTAEADQLYPREYFDYVPPTDDACYLPSSVWVLFVLSNRAKTFCKKPRGNESVMVVARDYLINTIEDVLDGLGEWGDNIVDHYSVFKRHFFRNVVPVVSFKTDNNMHRKTPYIKDSKCDELEFWGKSRDLIKEYLS